MKSKPIKRKRYNTHRIKQAKSYDINEICKLFDLHPNTVRQWIKDGLKPLDNKRPTLIHGSELKAFLDTKQKSRRSKCGFNQLYCFKCRCPQEPAGRLTDLIIKANNKAHLSALCGVCFTAMNRHIKSVDIPKFEKALELKTLDEATLYAPTIPRLNSDLNKDAKS